MNCPSEYKNVSRRAYCVLRNLFARPVSPSAYRGGRTSQDAGRTGFTLMESMAAVALLAFIGASVWVVMDRCMVSAADSTQRMRAFEIARENMEKLLGSPFVTEMTEYGVSEKFPDIRWQTIVEGFYEPITSRIWVRAVCSAEYSDSAGENQTVELDHWLTDLTKEQLLKLMQREELKKQQIAQHVIETGDLAAEYAGVDEETVREWVQNGMPVTDDGVYLKPWLDLYLETDGSPTEQDRQDVLSEYPELAVFSEEENSSRSPRNIDTMLPVDVDPETRKILEQLLHGS